MPDITMCSSSECPMFQQCYRAQAVPSMMQYYSAFYTSPHLVESRVHCTFFWPLTAPPSPPAPPAPSELVLQATRNKEKEEKLRKERVAKTNVTIGNLGLRARKKKK